MIVEGLRQKLAPQERLKVNPITAQVIEGLLGEYAVPYLSPNPRVLIVGFGGRIEEILAAINVLGPAHVTAADPGTQGEMGIKKWRKHFLQQDLGKQIDLLRKVAIKRKPFEDIPGHFDAVFAFNLYPFLQNREGLEALLGKTDNLLAITAHKNGGFSWGDTPEPDFVNNLINGHAQEFLIVPMQKLSVPTDDGNIWVLRKPG